jgi:hypothetical protein
MPERETAPSRAGLKSDLVPFETLGVDAATFLKALVKGEAPAPMLIGGALFFERADVSRWRTRLSAYAAGRYASILSEARHG